MAGQGSRMPAAPAGNPFAGIVGYAEFLAMPEPQEPTAEDLQRMMAAAYAARDDDPDWHREFMAAKRRRDAVREGRA